MTALQFPSRPTRTEDLIRRVNDPKTDDKERNALKIWVKEMIRLFEDDQKPSFNAEAALVSDIADEEDYPRLVLGFSNAVIKGTTDATITDPKLLANFAYCLRRAKNEISRETTQLGVVLNSLNTRLQDSQKSAQLESQYHVVRTIATVLDAMVDIKISGLGREAIHEPLLNQLHALESHEEPRLAQIAGYAHQALKHVPDDESPWQAFGRYSWKAIEAIARIAGGVSSMDPTKLVGAAPNLIELIGFFQKAVTSAKDLYKASNDIKDLINGLKDASEVKGWYGLFACCDDASFWCGLYAQLESTWVAEKPLKDGIVAFIKWTLQQPCLEKLSSKSRSAQQWVVLVSRTMNQPDWERVVPQKKHIIRFWKRNKHEPKLKRFAGESEYPDSGRGYLLQTAWEGSDAPKTFYTDSKVVEYYINGGYLEIKRLSGEQLPMENCYINLALVENAPEKGKTEDKRLESSLCDRLKIGESSQEKDVPLSDLFTHRKLKDGSHGRPKRILIRGRAGVGKTTLCKRIVHDFIHDGMWKDQFDRVLWIPLRRLKGKSDPNDFIPSDYFALHEEKDIMTTALRKTVSQNDSRTLLILDGLDEVAAHQTEYGVRFVELFQSLLNRHDTIVTSRPYAINPSGLKAFDLEVETIGFRSNQVNDYLRKVMKDETTVKSIQAFISQHWAIQGLIQIPIQLDAFCFTWDEDLSYNELQEGPKTMTSLYQAIELKLWRKDMVILGRRDKEGLIDSTRARNYHPREPITTIMRDEMNLIELLAFNGFYHNITEFDQSCRTKVFRQMPTTSASVLDRLSFMRTSDSSLRNQDRNHYFIHLTFQEFFAAQYFVRCWIENKPLICLKLNSGAESSISTGALIEREKYNGRYDIMWRFVSGLLQAEDEDELGRFLQKLDDQPRDLLGTVHSRLLMHCFSEVSGSDSNPDIEQIQSDTDIQLARLLLFECLGDVLEYSSTIGCEIEFPERILQRILQKGPDRFKWAIITAVTRRPQISLQLFDLVVPHLKCDDRYRRRAAADVICRNSEYMNENLIHSDETWKQIQSSLQLVPNLCERILRALLYRTHDVNDFHATCFIMRRQNSLPEDIIEHLVSQIRHEDERRRAFAAASLSRVSLYRKEVSNAVATLLDSKSEYIRILLLFAISDKFDLPRSVLKCLKAKLLDETTSEYDKRKVVQLIGRQYTLPKDVLEALMIHVDSFGTDVQDAILTALVSHSYITQETHKEILVRSGYEDTIAATLTAAIFGEQPVSSDDNLEQYVSPLSNHSLRIAKAASDVFKQHSDLPADIQNALFNSNPDISSRGWDILGNQSILSDRVLDRLVDCVDSISVHAILAVEVLSKQRSLPDNALQSVASLLTIDFPRRQAAIENALGKHGQFHSLLESLDEDHWVPLFKIYFRRSFKEGVVCYIWKDQLCINMPDGSFKVSMEHPDQRRKLEAALQAIQERMEKTLEGFDQLGLAADI